MTPPAPPSPPSIPRSSAGAPRSRRAGLDRARDRAPTTRRWPCSSSAAPSRSSSLAALEFVLMRMQLIVPENTVINPEIFNRILLGVRGHGRRPVRDPAGARPDRLHRAAADRRAGGRLPAARAAVRTGSTWPAPPTIYGSFLYGRLRRDPGAAAALDPPVFAHPRRRRLDRRRRPLRLGLRRASRSTCSRLSATCARPAWPGAGRRSSPGPATAICGILLVIGPVDGRGARHAHDRPPLRRRSSSTPSRAARRCSTSTSPGSSSPAPT